MSIRLRPMDNEDLRYLYHKSVMSAKSISEPDEAATVDKFKMSKAKSHVRSYIALSVPCINSVVCGSRYAMASKLLGVDSDTIESLARFTLCIEASSGVITSASNLEGSASSYLFNGQALEVLIDQLNATQEVEFGIENLCVSVVGKECEFYATQEKTDYPVIGDWFLDIKGVPAKDFTLSKLRDSVIANIKNGKYTRVTMLINLLHTCGSDEDVRTYLKKALVLNALPTIPINRRPKLGNKEHPTTSAYSRLFNNNNNYSIYANGSAEDFKEFYKTIFALVDSIICTNHFAGNDPLASLDKDMKNVRPLLEVIKGKNGLIREQMLKKRQDYSGRSAVIVDPFMPLNSIGMPRSAIPKLYRRYILDRCDVPPASALENIHSTDFDEYVVRELIKSGVISEVPMLLGRNPTLHRHGIQGFNIVPVEGRAIKVNPLVCPAFNMDFDGDTAHTETPITSEAVNEIHRLVMTDRNILLPKTGESTICPRMDIVYGLYMCTRATYQVGASVADFDSASGLKEAIYAQRVRVWDTVTVKGMRTDLAGKLAFESCFPKSVANAMQPTPEINSKNISKYIARIQGNTVDSFGNTINSLVELGFKVAYLHNTSVSMLAPMSSATEAAKKFDMVYEEFHKRMQPINDLNDFGFYDPETYGMEYSNCLRDVDRILEQGVYDKIGDNNMYALMARSGARGNTSNLVQMFGGKGRIQKSDSELFNVTIEHSLHQQLTPMEHAIAANGARKGQIAKSIKTADTGYLARKLMHVGAPIIITTKDCGTRDGITIRRDEIASYLYKENMSSDDYEKANDAAVDIMARFIAGRYQAENGVKISESEAYAIASSKRDAKIKIRSPLTCQNPCCQKCYGNDPSTGRTAAIGLAVGIIASQAMGEPSTQLTMKEFQKGGTAGAASSPFDRLNAVLCQSDIRREAKEGRYNAYSPIAWAPGRLVMEDYPGMNILLKIEPDPAMPKEEQDLYNYKITRVVPANNAYKIGKNVVLGEQLRVASGDCYIPEVIQILGTQQAQLTLTYMLYFLFKSQVNLVPVHLEVMVSGMTGYMPLTTDVQALKLGKYYTRRQLRVLGENYRNTEFMSNIRGVSSTITNNVNFLEALIMEDQRRVLSDAVLNGAVDLGDSPLVQMALGQRVQLGTGYNPNFAEDR